MQDVMRGTILGYGSGDVSGMHASTPGMVLLSGIRMRTSDCEVHWLPKCIVGPEAMLILDGAVHSGEATELWMTGKAANPYVYGIRTATERSYANAVASARGAPGHFLLIVGLLTLILGIGLLFLLGALCAYMSAAGYGATYTREQFNLGYERGVLGRAAVAEAPALAVPA